MKHNPILVLLWLAASSSAFAYDTQINFSGSFINSTCKINGGAIPASMTVTLGRAEARKFGAAGDTQMNKDFTISLSDCTAATTTVKWDNMVNVDASTGALKNTVSGGSNIQIRVLNGTAPVNMASDSGRSFTGTSAQLVYTAQYYAKTVPVTPGQVSTFGTITLSYN
ncbi:fimbrial protein [Pseudomonas sp. Pseusp97]|uniref:fimbrial protein n=1 Tax=Pseudomonas sp. Pseusp97 TaxID=3243065 RepID=UPI0039A6B6E9